VSGPWRGIFTPLVTPLSENERPDIDSLRRLVRFQVDSGAHGLWAMGTSAEFAAFDAAERAVVVAATIESADDRIPVIANVSDASTRLVLRHAENAVAAGAAAVAITPPYYYPHSQDELLRHYERVAERVAAPVFIYNIPQTVRTRLELATVKSLIRSGTVAGIKDSQNDLEWFRQLANFVETEHVQFSLFAGTRHLIDAAVLAGADGAIPSLANAFPALCVAIYESAARGDWAEATRLERDVVALESVAAEIGPGSRNAAVLGVIKSVLAERGIIASSDLTSPLRPLTREEKQRLLGPILGRLGEQLPA
jgi:4-hydroxy-tetrahydrodipicolinate synthase